MEWLRNGSGRQRVANMYKRKELSMSLLQIILSVILPPVAVFLKAGVGAQLLINIVLCFFFWLPAVIHALWVSAKGEAQPV